MLKYFFFSILCFTLPIFIASPSEVPEQPGTVFPETVMSNEGYSSFMVGQNKWEAGDTRGMETKEVERPDGGKDRIYTSGTTEEEEMRSRQEEREKTEKSLDFLRNIIIEPEKRKPASSSH